MKEAVTINNLDFGDIIISKFDSNDNELVYKNFSARFIKPLLINYEDLVMLQEIFEVLYSEGRSMYWMFDKPYDGVTDINCLVGWIMKTQEDVK